MNFVARPRHLFHHMSTLTLLRHGQASFGADRYDTLSLPGEQQARRVGEHLKTQGRNFDSVFVGPRERHRITAQFALRPIGADWEVEADPALDEFAEGQQILAAAQIRQGVKLRGAGAVTGKDAARCYVREIEAWARGEVSIDGVPQASAFRRGVGQWRDRITAQAGSGVALIAVTSGGVIAALVADALELPDAAMAQFMGVIYNASITEFAFSSGRAPSLVSLNEASFLPRNLLTRI